MPKQFEICNKSNKAIIKIVGEISWWKNSSQEFIRQIDELIAAGVVDVEGYLNTPGGSMFEANEIGNQVQRFTGEKSCLLGALVASAGTVLSTYFDADKIEASSNTQYMIHDPMYSPQITRLKQWDSEKKLYVNLRNDAIDRYVALTGQKREDVDGMMERVTWMNAKELLAKKFVAKIRNEKASLPEDAKAVLNRYSVAIPELLNQAFETPEIDNTINQETNMKEIAKLLGLPENATEDQISKAVKALQEQAKFGVEALTATAESKGLDKEAIKNLAITNFGAVVALVTNTKVAEAPKGEDGGAAPAGGKVPAAATATPATPATPATLEANKALVTDVIKALTGAQGGGAASNKKWEDYSPKELEALEKSDEKLFNQLLDEYTKS